MSNSIVTVSVSQLTAGAPITLQQSGAIVSVGGTNTPAGTFTTLTIGSDLAPILAGAISVSMATWASGVATITLSSPHGVPTSTSVVAQVISNPTSGSGSGYAGVYTMTATSTTVLTYPLVSNPGTLSVALTWTPESAIELTQMISTFYGQGNAVNVQVFECGESNVATAVGYLNTWIQANLFQIYAWLVPREWASDASFSAMVVQYESTVSKVYFFTTVTSGNYTNFTALMKDVFMLAESPSIATTTAANGEFSCAAAFYNLIAQTPSAATLIGPFQFKFMYGVTPWTLRGNGALLTTFKANGVNYITTGAEGGIPTAMVKWGKTADLRDLSYWYSVDWMQLNVRQDLANEIINGSNNPSNPLYLSQAGINRLVTRLTSTVARGTSFGLVNTSGGQPIISAIPFVTYYANNPTDYKTGTYNGLGLEYVPNLGFSAININIEVSDFPIL